MAGTLEVRRRKAEGGRGRVAVFAVLMGLLAAMALGAGPAPGPPDILLQRGMYREDFEGDLAAAMAIYKEVLRDPDAPNPLVSLARERLERCYLKQGNEGLIASSFIRITELMYNPLGGYDYEFLELKNLSADVARDLSGMRFRGIDYTFPSGTRLAPRQIAVLVKNPASFRKRYPGIVPFGTYGGRLDSGGERITLMDELRRTVTSVRYNDGAPWPAQADGKGYSIVPLDPGADPDDPLNWRRSNALGGSPGRDDGALYDPRINEVFAPAPGAGLPAFELYNAGPGAVDLGGWYVSDTPVDYRAHRVRPGTVLEGGAYLVLDPSQLVEAAGRRVPFTVPRFGGALYLTRWDGDQMRNLVSRRFDACDTRTSLGFHTTSDGHTDFVLMAEPTLGRPNAGPRVGPVIMNEIRFESGPTGLQAIELLSLSDAPVPLYEPGREARTWRLGGSGHYSFPPGVEMAPREYLLVATVAPAYLRRRYSLPADVRIFGPYELFYVEGPAREKLDIDLYRPAEGAESGLEVPYVRVEQLRVRQGRWPVNAEWAGRSLQRLDPRYYGNDPLNWVNTDGPGTLGRANSGTLVCRTAVWRYFDKRSDPGPAWAQPEYDDSSWARGVAPLGYGEHYIETEIASKGLTFYCRTGFVLAVEPQAIGSLVLDLNYDDGFAAYLNGREVLRRLLPPGPLTPESVATASHEGGAPETFDLSAARDALVRGRNVFAVQVRQTHAGSGDCVLEAELTFNPPSDTL